MQKLFLIFLQSRYQSLIAFLISKEGQVCGNIAAAVIGWLVAFIAAHCPFLSQFVDEKALTAWLALSLVSLANYLLHRLQGMNIAEVQTDMGLIADEWFGPKTKAAVKELNSAFAKGAAKQAGE